jgi:F-type H+-transporting ATPase subunit a
MLTALFASLLALQPLPAVAQSVVGVHDSKPAPVPASERPKVDEHGVTPGDAHRAARHEGEAGPGPETASEKVEEKEGEDVASHIFHHVQDEVWVPLGVWIGARHLDLSITKHVINMWIAAGILLIVLALVVRKRALVPKGGYSLVESFVLFVRDEIAVKNIGAHAGDYVSYLCSAFFFILFMNLSGLLPIPAIHGKFPGISTATGNIGVTVVLALFTFVITQIAGMRAQGAGGYWMHLVPSGVPKALFPLMFVIEFFGLFTKPFALTVRLFANMVAGHIVIFFLLALTILLPIVFAPLWVAFALGIFLLEMFVGLVQAYIFTMLSAVFIGMTQHQH